MLELRPDSRATLARLSIVDGALVFSVRCSPGRPDARRAALGKDKSSETLGVSISRCTALNAYSAPAVALSVSPSGFAYCGIRKSCEFNTYEIIRLKRPLESALTRNLERGDIAPITPHQASSHSNLLESYSCIMSENNSFGLIFLQKNPGGHPSPKVMH